MRVWFAAACCLVLTASIAEARNTPCSGSKGGISHCRGSTFVCNNGTTSQSKQACSAGDNDGGSVGGYSSRGGRGKKSRR